MKNLIRITAALGFIYAGATPSLAFAETIKYFNDGAGNCGYVSCGANGCAVIDMFPCPKEVSDD
jgi:hypothetical protein